MLFFTPILQIVYGSTLPPPPNHLPNPSFDENGRYMCQLHLLATLGEDKEEETGKEELHSLVKNQQASFQSVPGFDNLKQTLQGGDFCSVVSSGHSMFGQLSAVSSHNLGFPSGAPVPSQVSLLTSEIFQNHHDTVLSHLLVVDCLLQDY